MDTSCNAQKTKAVRKGWIIYFLPLILLLILVGFQKQRLGHSEDLTSAGKNLISQQNSIATGLDLAAKMPAFGFDNVFANWFFLRFLQYFGDFEAREQTGYGLSADFFEPVINKDPFYRMFYFFMSSSVSNYAGQPERAITLINQGLESLSPQAPSDSFYVWQYRATDELLYLGDGEAAQRSYQTAADWARQSPHPDGPFIAEISQRTADFLATNPLSKKARISAWSSVLTNALDETTQQRAIEEIESLGGTVNISEDGGVSILYPQVD